MLPHRLHRLDELLGGVNFEMAWRYNCSARDSPGALPPVTRTYYIVVVIIITYKVDVGIMGHLSICYSFSM